jgi:hypothetical protein
VKVIVHNGVDTMELDLEAIPRQGDSVSYNNCTFIVYDVEWCLNVPPHVNLMLTEIL